MSTHGRNFSHERQTHTTASGTSQQWTFTFCDFDPPPKTRLERFATWYWIKFVLGTGGDRCLCKVGLGRLCGWLEERAQ